LDVGKVGSGLFEKGEEGRKLVGKVVDRLFETAGIT